MKKTVALLAVFVLLTFLLHAQQKQSRFFTELTFGPSFPIGKFADKTHSEITEENPSGFAKTGIAVNLSLGYYLNGSVGLLLSSGYSTYAQDWSGYHRYLKSLPNTNIYPNVEVDAANWKVIKIMGGGFFVTSLTSNDKLNLLTKLTAGVCKTAVPELNFTAYKEDGEVLNRSAWNKTDLSWTLCYQVSVGLQYKLTNKLNLLLDINSFNATPHKEYTFENYLVYGGRMTQTKKYKISTVNAMAGIALNF